MTARNELRYLVVNDGGCWQPIEKCTEVPILDFVIEGKDVPEKHRQMIESMDLPLINANAFSQMAKALGLPKPPGPQPPGKPFKCLEGLNFTVLGAERQGSSAKKLARVFGGSAPVCSQIFQLDHVVRRESNSPQDLQLFEKECKELLQIEKPTVIAVKELCEMVLEKIDNGLPCTENPRMSITRDSIRIAHECLAGLKFGISSEHPFEVDGTNVKSKIGCQGGIFLDDFS